LGQPIARQRFNKHHVIPAKAGIHLGGKTSLTAK